MMSSHNETPQLASVLYQSTDQTIVLLDIPRTLEESQTLDPQSPHAQAHGSPTATDTPARRRRILSAHPVQTPFPTPDPSHGESGGPQNKSPASQVAELMTAASCQSALDHLLASYAGPFHLPRLVSNADGPPQPASADGADSPHDGSPPLAFIPSKATVLNGSLQDLSHTVRHASTPKFDLILLDPPWPNRSAKRKKDSYTTVLNLDEMSQLLDLVPVASHLAASGLVGVWITNRSSILEFVTSSSGLFASWGLELVAEWTWLKVTALGEPIFDLDSTWRKPWEKLLIAKRIGAPQPKGLVSKTIIAVPDLHSRKPNLKGLFTDILGPNFTGLEVFARNLTAGWWSWGNEVLRFQDPGCWTTSEEQE